MMFMKKWQSILIVVAVALIGLGIVKNILVQTAISAFGSKIVGAPIRIGVFSIGFITQKVHIRDLKLYNPPGFPNEPLVDFPEIRVDYDVFALLTGKIHLRLVIVNMKEMVVIRNKEGKLNVDSLKVVQEHKAKAENKGPGPPAKKESSEMAFQIDKMKLNIEKVIVKDYSQRDQPFIQAYDLGLKDKTFENIDSIPQMITLIMVQALGPTAIKSAGLYAVATVLGVGFLPAGILGVIVGNDASSAEFDKPFNHVFNVCLELAEQKGEVKSQDKADGRIRGRMDGVDITIKVEKTKNHKIGVTVEARKYMIPRPEVAGGILYQISEKLK